MILNVQSKYVTNARPRIEPYLYVCHAGSDDGHWGRRHDRHLLYNRGRNCSSWHICRRLSRPIVRHMLCLLGAMLCLLLLRIGELLCLLLWNGGLLCLLLRKGRLLCLLLMIGGLLCLLLRNGRLLCLLLRSVTPDLSIGCISGLTTRLSS